MFSGASKSVKLFNAHHLMRQDWELQNEHCVIRNTVFSLTGVTSMYSWREFVEEIFFFFNGLLRAGKHLAYNHPLKDELIQTV